MTDRYIRDDDAQPICNSFYYKGRFFQDQQDFFEYVRRWPDSILSEETLTEMLDLLKKDILINLQFGCEIKNGDMNRILELAFFEAMKTRKNLR